MLYRLLAMIVTLLSIGLTASIPVEAQAEGIHLRVGDLDTSQFPEIAFQLIALDRENNVIRDLSVIELTEGGTRVANPSISPVDVNTDLIFVIDANPTIETIDEAGGLNRREKVRDAIVRFAERYMDPIQKDRISIIVPNGDGGRFLDKPGMSFHTEVMNAINFYETDDLGETPINAMLVMALDQAASSKEEGRFQAILLFSDAGQLATQLDYGTLIPRAQGDGVAIYTAIIGDQVSAEETDNASRLAEPTRGAIMHMPQPVEADQLYDQIVDRSTVSEIQYRSTLSSSGDHIIAIELDGSRSEQTVNLTIEPPSVSMEMGDSGTIIRSTKDPEQPLEQIEPTHQPLVARVEWPDGHPRDVPSVALLVNGAEVPLETPILDANGWLTFEWDIRNFAAGTYELEVRVIDELGLQGISRPLPLTIDIQIPVPVSEPTPEPPETTPAAAETEDEKPPGFLLPLILGIVLVFILASAGVLVYMFRDRQLAVIPASPPPFVPSPPAQGVHSPPVAPLPPAALTTVLPPGFAMEQLAGAYLEVLENAPEHTGLIPIVSSNVSIGRDPKRAQVPFNDKSVSRLHARIMESYGAYRIYDEGSSSGTYVNYERVSLYPRELSDKDHIHLGRVHVRFHLASSLTGGQGTEVYRPEDSSTERY